jgi:hypothetical protein
MAEFRRISGTLSKPVSSDPSPHIPPQQTTAIADCVDIDPRTPCMHETGRVNLSAGPYSVRPND